jgi:o-succinylbenzoate synthase
VAHLTCQRQRLQLGSSFGNARTRWDEREVLLLRLSGDTDPGWGEVAPLPGHSPDDLDACEAALLALPAGALRELLEQSSADALAAAVASAIPPGLPAARCGLEAALLDRLARSRGWPLWRLLSAAPPGEAAAVRPVPLCAVLPDEPSAAFERASALHARGVTSFKLKVGPGTLLADQLAILLGLRARFGSGLGLRVDANGTFDPLTVVETLARLGELGVELVEEPVSELGRLNLSSCPCPLALDESLVGLGEERQRERLVRAGCRAVVLKPMLLGGLAACLSLARAAGALGIAPVVSHLLEGPLGWSACAHLALRLQSERAAGLWPLPHQIGSDAATLSGGRLWPGAGVGLGWSA